MRARAIHGHGPQARAGTCTHGMLGPAGPDTQRARAHGRQHFNGWERSRQHQHRPHTAPASSPLGPWHPPHASPAPAPVPRRPLPHLLAAEQRGLLGNGRALVVALRAQRVDDGHVALALRQQRGLQRVALLLRAVQRRLQPAGALAALLQRLARSRHGGPT